MNRKKPITPEAARIRMADLCARAEHCEQEVREKLRKMGLPETETEKIIDFLIEGRFIDNARYARAFANDKVRFAGWGRRKIRMALMLKRIPSADIAEALEQIDKKEYAEALARAAESKCRGLDLGEYADRTRLFRSLAQKGFENELVTKEIRRRCNS